MNGGRRNLWRRVVWQKRAVWPNRNGLQRQANQQGLASVNPIFTWVRLAQRIPVRIHIDEVPGGVVLAAGMTATAQINPRPQSQAK